jgi:hypothetical protein
VPYSYRPDVGRFVTFETVPPGVNVFFLQWDAARIS